MKIWKPLARLLLMVGVCWSMVGAGQLAIQHWQGKDQDVSAFKTRNRISEIMRRTVKAGEGQIVRNGQVINTYTRRGRRADDIEEIKSYGDGAVPILAEYLSSSDSREWEFAMVFLGDLGGSRIVKPLRDVIFLDPSPTKREYAIRAITQAPWDDASDILRHAAASDPSREVRKVAREMLKANEQ